MLYVGQLISESTTYGKGFKSWCAGIKDEATKCVGKRYWRNRKAREVEMEKYPCLYPYELRKKIRELGSRKVEKKVARKMIKEEQERLLKQESKRLEKEEFERNQSRIEMELEKKHLLSEEDKRVMHRLLFACIQKQEDYLSQKLKNEDHLRENETYTQNLLEEWIKSPRLNWETVRKNWKRHRKFGEKWFLEIRRIMSRTKKPPDKWPVVIHRLRTNIWK
jgi:hypothetical protein